MSINKIIDKNMESCYFQIPKNIFMKNFLKNLYRLQGKEVEWAIVEEKTNEETTYKLALAVIGTRLYVDVAARRFFTTVELPGLISRKLHKAKEIPSGEVIVFEAEDDAEKRVILPKNFLQDIYGVTLYDKSLEGRLLL